MPTVAKAGSSNAGGRLAGSFRNEASRFASSGHTQSRPCETKWLPRSVNQVSSAVSHQKETRKFQIVVPFSPSS